MRAIVRDYVRHGQPVGSKSLAVRHRLKVSAATIRNDMAVLEELGYLTQPHTSAGRIPTDLGYRWFIDNWPGPNWPALAPRQQETIDELVRTEHRGLDEALDSTSHVLSDLTEATAVVVAPPSQKNLLRRLELLTRDDGRVTLLLIADSGVVEQGILEVPEKEGDLDAAARRLSAELDGVAFEDLAAALRKSPKPSKLRSKIAEEVDRIFGDRAWERVFRGGTANILSKEKFPDISIAHEVVDALEHPQTLSGLIEVARHAGDIVVFIGSEVPVEQMRSCAVVVRRFEAGSDRVGTLGVVGPTRMDYPHTIAAVEAVARSLTHLLGQ